MSETIHALGIDIGGTKIALGVVANDGRVLARASFPTDAPRGFDPAVQRIAAAARAAIQNSGVKPAALAGAGIGCTGPVNPRTGAIDNPHTLPGWEGRNLVAALSAEIDLPVWLENDADAAALLASAKCAIDAAIWGVLHSFLPTRIVVGGGLIEAHPDFFLRAARAAVSRARLLSAAAVTIAPAQLGNLAGLIGAARWAIDRAAQSPRLHTALSS